MPVFTYELIDKRSEQHIVIWFIAAIFVALAVPLALHDSTWAAVTALFPLTTRLGHGLPSRRRCRVCLVQRSPT